MSEIEQANTLEDWASSHWERLFRSACLLVGEAHAAADLVQETFLEAARGIDGFRGDAAPYTWLYRVLLRRVSRWRERNGRIHLLTRPDLAEAEPEQTPQMIGSEWRDELLGAVQGLPEHLRDAVVMKYLEGMTYVEIAETMETTEATIRLRLQRARAQLRRRLNRAVVMEGFAT